MRVAYDGIESQHSYPEFTQGRTVIPLDVWNMVLFHVSEAMPNLFRLPLSQPTMQGYWLEFWCDCRHSAHQTPMRNIMNSSSDLFIEYRSPHCC